MKLMAPSSELPPYIFMIYTYSPNWYRPQCLHLTDDSMLYCSNYLLYNYSLTRKQIDQQKCFRQVAIEYGLNHKDIKITAIQSNKELIFIGLNQPYLVLLDRLSLDVVRVVAIDGFESIQYLYVFQEGGMDNVVVCSREGNLLRYSLQQQKNALRKVDIRHKLSAIKSIYPIDNHHCAVFTRGTILIYNSDFTILEKVVEVSNNDTIYSVDCLKDNGRVIFAFLTKNKESHTVVTFEFNFKEEFPLQHKKKIAEVGDNIKKFDVNFYYPKKFMQKVKQNQKASLTIKLLSKDKLILTGKLGQIVTLHIDAIKPQSALSIKPYSWQEQQVKEYEVWTDSKHYKEIYFIYQHRERLYIVSTDHNLSVWQVAEGRQKYIYTLKFLTSGVQSFFYSQSDPRNVFALLRDSAIRSFTPLEEGSHQLNQYWKFSKKFKIKKAICHPFQQGVLALLTECNHIQLYDVFQDRLMKLIEIGQQVLNLSFQMPSVVEPLMSLMKSQPKEEKLKTASHFVKETMDNKTVILIQTKDRYIIGQRLAEKEVRYFSLPKGRRIERIHQNRYWDGQLMLTSQTKNNVLDVLLTKNGQLQTLQANLKYQQGRVLFKVPKGNQQLLIINFKGSKFTIFRASLQTQTELCPIISTCQVCLQSPIDYLFLSYHDSRAAIYGQRDDLILIIHLDRLTQEKYEISKGSELAQIYWFDSKIESLMLYLDQHLIAATKDQTIKVLNYTLLPPMKVPQKKGGTITRPNEETQQ